MKTKNNVIYLKNNNNIDAIQPVASDEARAFYDGKKWGYLDKGGNILIKPQFEECCAFKNGLAGVKKWGKWGFINKRNKTVIPFMYDILKPVHKFKKFYDYNRTTFNDYDGELCAPVCLKGKWGFIDILNRTVIPFRYEDFFVNNNVETSNLFCVKVNNLWGFIDKKRNTVIKFLFDNVEVTNHNPNHYTVIQKVSYGACAAHQNFGLVDSLKGIVVPCKFRCENKKD